MSATQQEFTTPLLPRVEFHVNRLKAVSVGGCAIALGMLIAYPPAAHQALRGTPQEICTAVVALSGATALVGFGLYILMRLLLWRGPAVVIDGHGVHDRRTGSIMLPWSCIHDIRPLDRHGGRERHIGIDTHAARKASGPLARLGLRHSEPVAIIGTFFLRSVTGNPVLDFVMPLTAMTPIDMSETPVSERTLSADAAFARNRFAFMLGFAVAAGFIPAVASFLIVF